MSDVMLKKITKIFPDQTKAVTDLNLEIKSGEYWKINESDVTLDSSDLIEYRIKGLGAKIITNLN